MCGFWDGKSVIVPGGAGFIGSSVVDALVARSARVTVIDDESSGDFSRLDTHGPAIRRIRTDVHRIDLREAFRDSDVVLNLAGLAPGLTPDEDRHERLYQENLRIADAVLEAAVDARVPRLLVVSSSCVYPDDAPVPTPELPLEQTEPEQANRGYGRAKREIEKRAIAAAGDVTKITIARPFNACGPRDRATGPGAHVIPSLLSKILDPATEEVVVWGSGRQTRSFLDARDVATALLLLVETHPTPDPVNIGSSEEISLADLVPRLMNISGISKPVRFDTTKPEGALRKGCDASLLRKITGFVPEYSLDDSLREIVESRIHTPAATANP
ncbi:nucleoside-diphosphate-sugar epimerase [Haloferula helveola]|uniref:Nucleoside-diphosphate-sugar epimerase n=1 Tax=Haloferula helveola TaxID=490095 RepID=A0ABM7RC10_9BACT|nr:nucleoside-diphosphate-sugar epimerase [Haloferula helveola]